MNESSEGAAAASITRERLLDATWEIVRDHGVHAATSRRITTAAETNLGSITYHFGSKSSLIAEAVIARLRMWTEPLGAALVLDETDGNDRTGDLIASLLPLLDGGGADARALLEVLLSPEVDRVVVETARQHLGAFQETVAALMRRQQDRGEIPATVDPAAMSGMFTAFALGLLAQQAIGANPAPALAIAAELLALLAR